LRQTLTEAALLGALGIVAAAVVVFWATNLIASIPVPGLPFRRPTQPGAAAYAYLVFLSSVAIAILGVTSLVAGLAGSRVSSMRLIRASTSRANRALRDGLVAVQVVLSVLLLSMSVGFTRTLAELLARDVGLDDRSTLVIELAVSTTLYPKPADQTAYIGRLREPLQRVPGVAVVGIGTAVPARRALGELMMPLPNHATGAIEQTTFDNVPITAGYLEAIGARLQSGRLFNDSDTELSAPVAVISTRAARRVFGTDDVIGRPIRVGRLPSTGQ
jgi:hypothetical protein